MNFLKGRMDDIEERQARALRSKSKKVSVTNFGCLAALPSLLSSTRIFSVYD